jgi:hypothetical protein
MRELRVRVLHIRASCEDCWVPFASDQRDEPALSLLRRGRGQYGPILGPRCTMKVSLTSPILNAGHADHGARQGPGSRLETVVGPTRPAVLTNDPGVARHCPVAHPHSGSPGVVSGAAAQGRHYSNGQVLPWNILRDVLGGRDVGNPGRAGAASLAGACGHRALDVHGRGVRRLLHCPVGRYPDCSADPGRHQRTGRLARQERLPRPAAALPPPPSKSCGPRCTRSRGSRKPTRPCSKSRWTPSCSMPSCCSSMRQRRQGSRANGWCPFRKEDYGIVFPRDHPLRKQVNVALLVLREDGTYQQLYDKWFAAK